MASFPTESPHNSRGYALLRKYHERHISLTECQELARWLEEGPLQRPWTPAEQRLAAKLVLDGVKALIIDKQYEETGTITHPLTGRISP